MPCVCSVTWLVALVVMLPIALTSTLEEHPDGAWKKCREDWSRGYLRYLELWYAIFLDIIVFGIPLLIMTIAYLKIGLRISESVFTARKLQLSIN